MRLLLVVTLFFLNLFSAYSQAPDQAIEAWREKARNTSFYKMEVREYGIYRITYTNLQGANYPLNSADLSVIRLFRRGEEVSIKIFDANGNNRLEQGDYIEFYGQPNDGLTDKSQFRDSTDFVNPYEPIYSKTAVYFLSSSTLDGNAPKRIQTSNVGSNGATAINYHWFTETYRDTPTAKSFNFRTTFSPGESTNGSDRTSFSSAFRGPRSWTTYNTTNKSGPVNFQLRTTDLYAGTSTNHFKIQSRIMNFSYRTANVKFQLGNSSGNTTERDNQNISRYEVGNIIDIALNDTDFGNGSTHVLLIDNFNGTGSDNNQMGVIYFNLTYPQAHASISGGIDKKFTVYGDIKKKISAPQGNESNFYNISNPNSPILLQKTNSNSKDEAIIAENGNTKVDIYFSAIPKSVTALSLAEFEFNNNLYDYNYLIISHPSLMKPSTSYNNPVEMYANYRKSVNGGGNTVYVANILKLYNSFSWGEENPQSIRNCINLLRTESLEYVLILGKGLDLNYDPFEKTPSGDRGYHYIPTYGYPGADNIFTMGFDGNETGVLPVGRVAAHIPQVIEDYLTKVQEHEALEFDQLWRKKALHLSGGGNAYQQEEFKRIVNKYRDVFVDTLEGGIVETISRENDGSIEFIDVSDIVNDGISLMTFFGHSSAQDADIDIGEASDPTKGYANQGKYPFIMMSGCGGGNLFTNIKSWGEDWIETPEKGAIGFMAKGGLGQQYELELFGDNFYEATFQKQIGLPIGDHMIMTHTLSLANNPSIRRIATIEQYGLQGDPFTAISPSKVDLSIHENQITIIPQDGSILSVSDDFYKLKLTIDNFGHTFYQDKIYVEVRRRYGNGLTSKTFHIDSVSSPFNSIDTVFTILNSSNDQTTGDGLNQISVTVGDKLTANGNVISTIDEINTSNNSSSINANFFSEKVSIIFPQKFSVTHDNQIDIFAFDYSADKTQKNVRFQLALDSAFTSVVLQEDIISNQLFKWSIPLSSTNDTTTYYLRSKLLGNENNHWEVLSFTKINNSFGEGWNQSTIYELKQNTIEGASVSGTENNLTWSFPVDQANINVKSAGASYSNGHYYEVQLDQQTYLVDGSCVRSGDSGDKLLFLVFDQFTGAFKGAQTYNWKPLQCGEGFPPVTVMFNSSDIRGGNVVGSSPLTRNGPYSLFIDPTYKFSSILRGDYVLTIMSGNFDFQGSLPSDSGKLDAYHKHLEGFAEIGLDTLDMQTNLTKRGLAFIGWSRFQMSPTHSQVFYATQTNQLLEENFFIQKNVTTATITTNSIGPSNQFSRLWVNADLPGQYSNIETAIYGIVKDKNGNITTPDSITTIKGISNSNGFDLDAISEIRDYDFISLKTYLMDTSSQRKIPQLRNWRVAYTPVAEGVMISKETDNPSKLQQGENTTYQYEFHNISSTSFSDSILIEINYNSVQNTFNGFTDTLYIPPLPSNGMKSIEIITDTWSKDNPSKRINGQTNITTIANGDHNLLEIFYNNNNSRTENLYVTIDSVNPIIEVLFDGSRILDGDIVSPSCEISLSMIDENKFIDLENNLISGTDTIINAFITPYDRVPIPIDLSSSSVNGVSEQNHIILNFNINEVISSDLLDDDGLLSSGRYNLEINAKDPSGNGAGYTSTDNKAPKLSINFEINKEASITNFYPYPNPFSDRVRFVFQVTGTDVPQQMKIQIMTVTGRVVREIFKEELGPIRIGNNITEYAWDGKDEFGDQLANGVYLYRVIIPQKNDGSFKHNETSADYMFKQNIGKLYLLR